MNNPKIIRTNLMLTIECPKCGAIWYATAVYGGIEWDADEMTTIAEAHNKGDKVTLRVNESVKMGECKCGKLF